MCIFCAGFGRQEFNCVRGRVSGEVSFRSGMVVGSFTNVMPETLRGCLIELSYGRDGG